MSQTPEEKKAVVVQLKRIEGQIRGIQKLVEEDSYCLDVMNQIQAVRSSLLTVNNKLITSHLNSCMAEAIEAGDYQGKMDEISGIIKRLSS